MVQKYFDKFPTVTYSNNEVVDITKRTSILEKVSSNPYVFYPYDISDNERADQLSSRYYDDSYRSWILYITNKIVDPYFEWYLSETEMVDFITKKYGSYYTAQSRIKFYRNNWINVDDITVSAYDALTSNMKNYWEPRLGYANKIDSYKRKQIDWKVSTNKIMNYSTDNSTELSKFIKDEVCTIYFDSYNIGKGQVLSMNNGLFLQHVSGTYENAVIQTGSYISGQDSGANLHFTAVTCAANNLMADEENYYKAVTYLDYETERNEYNKSIRVLDSNYKQIIVDNLKDLMKE